MWGKDAGRSEGCGWWWRKKEGEEIGREKKESQSVGSFQIFLLPSHSWMIAYGVLGERGKEKVRQGCLEETQIHREWDSGKWTSKSHGASKNSLLIYFRLLRQKRRRRMMMTKDTKRRIERNSRGCLHVCSFQVVSKITFFSLLPLFSLSLSLHPIFDCLVSSLVKVNCFLVFSLLMTQNWFSSLSSLWSPIRFYFSFSKSIGDQERQKRGWGSHDERSWRRMKWKRWIDCLSFPHPKL